MIRKPPAFHPFLVPLLPILTLYARNFDAVARSELIPPALFALAATLGVWAGLKLCRVDARVAALIASSTLILAFGFGPIARGMTRLGVGRDDALRGGLTLAIEGVAGLSLALVLITRPNLARWLTRPSDAAAVGLVALSVVGLGSRFVGDPDRRPPAARIDPLPPLFKAPRRPDVYLLILDAYGRSDVLKQRYGFDNSPFLDRLASKGFRVARQSTSNYVQTALSVAATLNFRYLDDLAGSGSTDRKPLRTLIADNAAFRAFRSQGYRIVSFASGFGPTEPARLVDRRLGPKIRLAPFEALLVDQTPFGLAGTPLNPHAMHRSRIKAIFDHLPELADDPAPTFCLAHVLSPHPPFVFGSRGEDVSSLEGEYSLSDAEGWRDARGHGGVEGYVARYRGQIEYVTRQVESAVDQILAASSEPPIILIQGDHGPGGHFESMSPQPNDLAERLGILNAWLIPGLDAASVIDEAITPVNTFRVVFDHLFRAGLGRLPDRSFYSPYDAPYRLTEVTGSDR